MISPAFFMASIVGFHVELSQAIYSGKRPYSTCMKFTSVTGPSVYWRSFWASASRVSVSWARASSESEEAARNMDKIIVLIIFSCDGEPTVPQVHYYHDNSTICARFCYSWGERFRSSCPVPSSSSCCPADLHVLNGFVTVRASCSTPNSSTGLDERFEVRPLAPVAQVANPHAGFPAKAC